eukprot:GHVP01062035.1.p1 GENE.GHVP01062035.1~~GHVP01062035.1.p1  ORF type:complete len:1044 (-),score=213.28 GHVP01062035.1:562-3414(-)
MAAILLRRLVQNLPPEATEEVEETKRVLLQKGILHPMRSIRESLHGCIAAICCHTGIPNVWPQLVSTIQRIFTLNTITNQSATTPAAREFALWCALKLLTEIGDSKDGAMYLEILKPKNRLQDSLLVVAQGVKQFDFAKQQNVATCSMSCRRQSLKVYRACVKRLIEKRNNYEIIELVLPKLPQWVDVFGSLIHDLEDSPLDLEVLQAAKIVIQTLRALASSFTDHKASGVVIEALDQCFESILKVLDAYYPVFENMILNDENEIEDSEEGGHNTFISQLFELFSSCAVKDVLVNLVQKRIEFILKILCRYLQISEAQKFLWERNPSEFVKLEEENLGPGNSVRIAASTLLNVFLRVCPNETKKGILTALENLITLSDLYQGSCSCAWKYLEVSFWLFGFLSRSEIFKEIYSEPMCENIVVRMAVVLGTRDSHIFLRSRALSTLGSIANFLENHFPGDVPSILQITCTSLQPSEHLVIRYCATKALIHYIEDLAEQDDEIFGIVSQKRLIPDLIQLMVDFPEATSVCLSVLISLLQNNAISLDTYEDEVFDLCSEIWDKQMNDPVIAETFESFIEAACAGPSKWRNLASKMCLPWVHSILDDLVDGANFFVMDNMALEISLSLISIFLRNTHEFDVEFLESFSLATNNILRLETTKEILHLAGEVMALLIIKNSQNLLTKNGNILQSLLNAISRLLDTNPDLDSSLLFLGPLLEVFFRHFGRHLAPQLVQEILAAVTWKVHFTQSQELKASLLCLLCRFVCEKCEEMIEILTQIKVKLPDGKDDPSVSVFSVFYADLAESLSNSKLYGTTYRQNLMVKTCINILKSCSKPNMPGFGKQRKEKILTFLRSVTKETAAEADTITTQNVDPAAAMLFQDNVNWEEYLCLSLNHDSKNPFSTSSPSSLGQKFLSPCILKVSEIHDTISSIDAKKMAAEFLAENRSNESVSDEGV